MLVTFSFPWVYSKIFIFQHKQWACSPFPAWKAATPWLISTSCWRQLCYSPWQLWLLLMVALGNFRKPLLLTFPVNLQLLTRLSGSVVPSQVSVYQFENHWADTMIAVKISGAAFAISHSVMLAAFPIPGTGNSTNTEMTQTVWLCVQGFNGDHC